MSNRYEIDSQMMRDVSELIRLEMARLGMRNKELCERSGLSVDAVITLRAMSGRVKPCSLRIIERAGDAMGLRFRVVAERLDDEGNKTLSRPRR